MGTPRVSKNKLQSHSECQMNLTLHAPLIDKNHAEVPLRGVLRVQLSPSHEAAPAGLCRKPSFKRGGPSRQQGSPGLRISSGLHTHQGCKGASGLLIPGFKPLVVVATALSQKMFRIRGQLPKMSQKVISIAVQ